MNWLPKTFNVEVPVEVALLGKRVSAEVYVILTSLLWALFQPTWGTIREAEVPTLHAQDTRDFHQAIRNHEVLPYSL